jgi:hypothetical protein
MTRLPSLLLLLAVLVAGFGAAPAAHATTLRAVLITASTEPGATDPRLAAYEATLKRVFRFQSYAYQGSDSGELASGRTAELLIGQGHELTVEPGENPLAVRIRWTEGGRALMTTGVTLRPGVPAVLGGPRTGNAPGEVYAVILVAR